jgi:hypothetical protein
MKAVKQCVKIHKRGTKSEQFAVQIPSWWVIQHGLATKSILDITFNPDGSILLVKQEGGSK